MGVMTPQKRSELIHTLSLSTFHTFAEIARQSTANQQALIANFGEAGGPEYIFMSQLWNQLNDYLDDDSRRQ